jgi:hypothetical protein
VKGIVAGALTLIMLQVLVASKGGPESAGKFIGWINTGITKALSPSVALIPTRKTAPAASAAKPSTPGVSLPNNPPVGTVQV